MEWIFWATGLIFVIGAIWAIRDHRRGGSEIIDERDPAKTDTEADREAIRAWQQTRF